LPVFSINNDTTICNGSVVQLNATGNSNYHYHWTPPDYLSDTSIYNPVSTPADSIKYYVTAIDSNNCMSSDSIQINVFPKPLVATINNTNLCLGDSILLSTTVNNANKFTWNPATGLSNNSIQSPKASPAKTITFVITASNNLCSSKDSVKITVLSLPKVLAGNDTIVCSEGSAQLQATGALSYKWSPAATLSDPNIANPIAVPSVNTIYYLTGTDKNNCINTDSVTVFKQEDPIFSVFPEDTSICSGEKISLTASGGDTYKWTPSQSVSSPNSAKTSVHPLTNTQYSVHIYDSTCKISKTLNTTINILALPKITITKSNDIDCSNRQAQLNANGGINYTWLLNTYIDNTKIANPTVNPPEDTWYAVDVIAENGCISKDSILVKSTLGNMGLYVATAFTPNGDGLNDCFGVKYWGQPATFDFMIYDKWGMPVYHSKNVNECWDGTYKGKKQGSGTYVYMITATSACGQDKVFRKGTIVLIR
jgi:gliding motility-associated-like protein